MLLTEKRLRALIHDILLEGVREDAAALEVDLEGNPEALRQLQSLSTKPKWVNWLADRYLRQKYPVDDTLPDVLSLVVNFASKEAAISQKYGSNEQFKTAVDAAFPPESRGWTNPADVTKMSDSDLNTILVLYDRKKQRIEVDRADESWKRDKIGQFGPWALYFPTSQQNSINIAGADPVTLKGYTTWCTARTAGSNLFYFFAGMGTMLFYAIDESKPPTDPKSRISLGYQGGKLNVSGKYGDATVDAQNKGLKMPALQKIFGSHLSGILAAAEAVVQHHGAEHPAKAEFAEARQDVVKFKRMLKGLSDNEAGDLCRQIFRGLLICDEPAASPEVLLAGATHKSFGVRKSIAYYPCTTPSVLESLAADPDDGLRAIVAFHRNTPPRALEKLAADAYQNVRLAIVQDRHDRKVPPHVIERLSADIDVRIRREVALNKFTPAHVFEKLAADRNPDVRQAVAGNKSTPPHVLEKLADNVDDHKTLARNPSTPPHVLEKLAASTDSWIRICVAGNRSAPPHVLERMSTDIDRDIRGPVSRNPSTPAHVLEKLVDDRDLWVRQGVALNDHTPLHILEKLAASTERDVRESLAWNHGAPLHILKKLASDRDTGVRNRAKKTLAAIQSGQPWQLREVAHRIIAELKRR